MTSRLVPFVMTVTAFALSVSHAWAQPTPSQVDPDGFQPLSAKLKVGESIIVTTDTGAEIRGRFLNISTSSITLHVNDIPQQVPAGQVYKVQTRRNGVLLGALIGSGVGVPFGLALKSYAHNEGGSESGALAFPIAVGLGVGIAIDAFLVRPRTVYERSSSFRSTIIPTVTSRQIGILAIITF